MPIWESNCFINVSQCAWQPVLAGNNFRQDHIGRQVGSLLRLWLHRFQSGAGDIPLATTTFVFGCNSKIEESLGDVKDWFLSGFFQSAASLPMFEIEWQNPSNLRLSVFFHREQ